MAEAKSVAPESVADLITRYCGSPEWAALKPATHKDYRKALDPLREHFGRLPVAGMQRRHVTSIRDRYAWREEPDPNCPGRTRRVPNIRQANRIVTVLSILMSYAVDPLGWRPDNPALRPKRLTTKEEGGYRPWTQAEFAQFWERSAPDWQFAALLALLTGQRGQDLVALRWSDYDGTVLRTVQQKGRRRIVVELPVPADLRTALEARRAQHRAADPSPLTILARADGSAWPVNAWQKAAGVAIRAAGLTGLVWHGLRGAAASWAAEAGATQQQVAALLGHQTLQMVQKYGRGAANRTLAGAAAAVIPLPQTNKTRPGSV